MGTALAATRLNLLQGNESSCVERAMGDAEAWLAAHPPEGPGSGVRTGWWKAGSRLRAVLERYNRGRLCVPAAR